MLAVAMVVSVPVNSNLLGVRGQRCFSTMMVWLELFKNVYECLKLVLLVR